MKLKFPFGRKKKPSASWVFLGNPITGELIASTEQIVTRKAGEEIIPPRVRDILRRSNLVSESLNPQTAVKISQMKAMDVEYPEDYSDFENYKTIAEYVPWVARAISLKEYLIWKNGFTIEPVKQVEGENPEENPMVKKAEEFLQEVNAEVTIRAGTYQALVFGSAYWLFKNNSLRPLDAMKMGRKYDKNDPEKIISFVMLDRGKRIEYKPEEILFIDFNLKSGMSKFGTSSLRRVLPIVKAMLYMEEKLPNIARRRGDPLLEIIVDDPDPEEARRKAEIIMRRAPGEDIYHGPGITIKEVYTSGGIAARQTLSEILGYYREQLVAGLGVHDIALGFGGTTTKATALFQEDILEGEIISYQRVIKRFLENQLFPRAGIEGVKVNFRPLKVEDMKALSEKMMREIEHGVVSPDYASKKLGYPPEALENRVMNTSLQAYIPIQLKKEDEGENKSA